MIVTDFKHKTFLESIETLNQALIKHMEQLKTKMLFLKDRASDLSIIQWMRYKMFMFFSALCEVHHI